MTPPEWGEHFQARRDTLENDLRELVNRESPTDDPERVSEVARFVAGRLSSAGIATSTPKCPPRGDALVATLSGGGGTLLLGHHDTVWPVGTLASIPYAVRDGVARGPGVFDMKAGIAVAIAVLEAVSALPAPPRATLLLTPDEEEGTGASRGLLEVEARRCRRALVLEPSQDGDAKIARKGTGNFRVSFRGAASHAGLEPEKGASALSELARFVIFAEALSEREAGTTVTPTVARAGDKSNVVPESAEVILDARIWTAAEAGRVAEAIRGYRPRDARVAMSVDGGFNRPPMEPTPASEELFARASEFGAEIGLIMGAVRVGGASDGNFTAAMGVATLDGLGPRGDGAHARNEHVLVADLPLRAALLASLLTGDR